MSRPVRPTHFGHGPEQRTEIEAEADFTTEVDTQPEELGWPEPELEAIPVTVVQPMPRDIPLLGWTSEFYLVRDVPQRILGARRNRVVARIVNNGAVDVTVGPDQGVTAGRAGVLVADQAMKFTHNGEMWAVCASATETTLTIVTEYEIEDTDE